MQSLFITATLLRMLCILLLWTLAHTIQNTAEQQQWSAGITSNGVLMYAIGPTTILMAWWTEDASQISSYSASCSERLPIEQSQNNTQLIAAVGHMQSVSVLKFTDKSINSVRVSQLMPLTSYRCCLIEYNINNSFTAEVCRNTITINSGPPVFDSEGCPNNSHIIGSIASLFVMMLLALLCTLLLFLLVIKLGKHGEKITHWFEQVKNENELLKQRMIDSNDSITDSEEASMEESHQYSAVDNTEERMSHSIVTSVCVAYRCVADRNPSTASDSDSVVYAVPFDTC